jgi:hypothetical protein
MDSKAKSGYRQIPRLAMLFALGLSLRVSFRQACVSYVAPQQIARCFFANLVWDTLGLAAAERHSLARESYINGELLPPGSGTSGASLAGRAWARSWAGARGR